MFLETFGVLSFLDSTVLRFALLLYYGRNKMYLKDPNAHILTVFKVTKK